MEFVKYQPEYNPEAIISYCSNGVQSGRSKKSDVNDLILKAKKHLSAIGWSFSYIYKNPSRRELRYRSPAGKIYYSLRTACQSLVNHKDLYNHVLEVDKKPETKSEKRDDCLSDNRPNNRPGKRIRIEDVEMAYFQREKERSLVNYDSDSGENKIRVDQDFERIKKPLKKEQFLGNDESDVGENKTRVQDFERIKKPRKKKEQSLLNDESDSMENKIRVQDFERIKKGIKKTRKKKDEMNHRKLVRKMEGLCSSTRRRCVLSLLIDKNILRRGSPVSYCKKDGRILAKGRVFDDGIRCDCCDQLFLLSKFEAHAGSTYHRPAANLFLDDGRSLFDCQSQLQRENNPNSVKSSQNVTGNDAFCSFCNDGGELVLCDSCTSSFHATCVGLIAIPDSDYWFCPSCCCGICHEGSKDHDRKKCAQCELRFHVDCVTNLGNSVSTTDSNHWFCSLGCERLFSGLNQVSGQSIPLTKDNLTWSLLKLDKDQNDKDEQTETYSKLNIALDVMHECFQPVNHPWSENDMVEDVIFSRSSKRSNFNGFFTAVLEKDDEMMTVATVRVRGCKVAEIPLVATRFRHRRLGMCRVLMDAIERKLGELGVERVVLPAVPETVSTWTGSFGFSVMSEIDRRGLVHYKFLDFPGTIKCVKSLK